MLSRLKRLVSSAHWLCGACDGRAGPRVARRAPGRWNLDRVFSGNVFSSNHLKPKDYPIHGIDVSKIPGRYRLERGRQQRRQIRLDQGDRGRRPRRRALSEANWEGAKAAGASPMAAPITSSIGAAAQPLGGNQQLRTECASRGRRAPAGARRRGDANLTDLRRRHVAQDEAIADMQVMLQEMERRLPASGRSSIRPSISTRRIFPTAR